MPRLRLGYRRLDFHLAGTLLRSLSLAHHDKASCLAVSGLIEKSHDKELRVVSGQ